MIAGGPREEESTTMYYGCKVEDIPAPMEDPFHHQNPLREFLGQDYQLAKLKNTIATSNLQKVHVGPSACNPVNVTYITKVSRGQDVGGQGIHAQLPSSRSKPGTPGKTN